MLVTISPSLWRATSYRIANIRAISAFFSFLRRAFFSLDSASFHVYSAVLNIVVVVFCDIRSFFSITFFDCPFRFVEVTRQSAAAVVAKAILPSWDKSSFHYVLAAYPCH